MTFLIFSFDYDWKSGGNQVLHDLAKILSKDYTTYVCANKTLIDSKAICINFDKTKELAALNDTITIYPEVITGNPFNAKNVVRYVLYYPGWHAGDKEYNESELVITYNHEFVRNTKYDKSFILTVLDPKLSIMQNTGQQRDKIGLLVRKCKDFDYKMSVLKSYKHLINLPIISIDEIIDKCNNLNTNSTSYNANLSNNLNLLDIRESNHYTILDNKINLLDVRESNNNITNLQSESLLHHDYITDL